MAHAPHIRSIRDLLRCFFDQRAPELNRRMRRNYEDVVELIEEYLEARGLDQIDMRAAPEGPVPPRTAPVAAVVDLLDDFEDEYLIATIGAERDFMRVAEYAVRDLVRWLRGRRITRSGSSVAATA